ncbi:SdrD B-like domain-containing protein [Agreia sp. PsM10]|uniref:DUF7507 domain-containing protein n=1 Tax=Agreia sp. PsM10 TaxID=3030533 RepID=UPI00263B146C|nr:SdrD B-like domain-containing protein [Agreia sp. PsM10]MDN4640572.1 SdrD B-like domain-containing protein [Agreia sp. PsM10]
MTTAPTQAAHPPRRARYALAAVATLLTLISTIFVGGLPAQAAVISAQLGVISDGTGPFDELDADANNGLVRTHDTVAYGWQYNTDETAVDATFVQTISAPTTGVTFSESSLVLCTGPNGGSISADGLTITCQVALPANTTGSIPINVTVDGTNPNGTVITTALTVDSVDAGTQLTTIVAAPNFDLKKNIFAFSAATVLNGELGRYASYVWAVSAPTSLKGSENLTSPFTFVDDVSGVSPNAQLISCPAITAGYEGYHMPYSAIGITPAANAGNSVANSGTTNCTQPNGAGTDIQVTVTGADLSADSIPTLSADSNPVAGGSNYVATGIVFLFIPTSDIVDAGGSIDTTNQFRGFDPDSISGQSNFGTGYESGSDPTTPACEFVSDNSTRANNNCFSFTMVATQGAHDKYLLTMDASAYAGGGTGAHAGNGVVAPGTEYQSQLVIANVGVTDFTGQGICDIWDPATQQITAAGDVLRNSTTLMDPSQYTVEFGAFPLTNDDDRRNLNCGTGTWYPSIAAAGGASVVNAIRFLPKWDMTPNEQDLFRVRFVAVDNPYGTIIGDWANVNFGGGWSNSNYDKNSNTGGVGDRLTLTPAQAGISKTTVPAASSVLAGQSLTYRLQPTLTTAADTPAPVENVTVVDTLPSCLQYVASSASLPVTLTPGNTGTDGIPCTGDTGETGDVLTFALGTQTPNTVLPAITYQVSTLGTTPNGTHASNTAVVSFDGADPIDLSRRTAVYDIVILNQAQFSIAKTTDTPLVQVRDSFRYTISYRNNTGNTVAQAQLIDELPYNGDSRGTSYTGQADFAGATGVPSNAVVECTTDAHGTIGADPATNTNTWSTACPANTTAVRITVTTIPDAAVGGVTLQFTGLANQEGDHYINNVAGARVSGLTNVIPPTAPVRVDVIASTIGDVVWNDANYNGLQDEGETGVEGVTVTLAGTDDLGNPVSASTTTAADGSYLFSNLRAGTYTVSFTAPSGEEFTIQNAGDGSNDSRVPVGLGTQSAAPITLGVDSDNLAQDAGISSPDISLVKSASPPANGEKYQAGETVTYTFVATNTGPTPLTGVTVTETSFTNGAGDVLTLTTPIVASVPSPFDGTLASGASVTFTATYVVTQADVDAAGSIDNSAHVVGLSPAFQQVTDDSDVSINTGTPAPGISLVKGVANKPANGVGFVAGETVKYIFTVRNTGNVTLSDVTVTEDSFTNAAGQKLKLTTGPDAPAGFTGTLAPGEQVVFTGSYILTAADTTGDLVNVATVTGTPPTGTPPTSTDRVKTPTYAPPGASTVSLPNTGIDVTSGAMGALLLLLLGTVLMMRRRRLQHGK